MYRTVYLKIQLSTPSPGESCSTNFRVGKGVPDWKCFASLRLSFYVFEELLHSAAHAHWWKVAMIIVCCADPAKLSKCQTGCATVYAHIHSRAF